MSEVATPPPAAPAEKPADKPLEAQISEGLRHTLMDRLKGKKEAPKQEKKVEEPPKQEKPKEEKPKAEEPKAEEPAAKPDDTKPTPKVKVAKKAPQPDAVEITKAATTAATKAVLESATVKKLQPDKPKAEDELPDKYKSDLPMLQRMEKMWPEKYRGITEKFTKSAKRVEAYKTQWETANPGREFNSEDDEHASFIAASEVDWEEGDAIDARAEIRAEQIMERERGETNKKFEELEHRLTEKDLEPSIRRRQAEVSRDLIKDLDKDLVVLIDADGRINKEELAARREADPEKVDTVMIAAANVARFIDTAERILHPSGRFKFDAKNGRHLEMAKFLVEQEDLILSNEDAQITKDGRRFATREEWGKLDEGERRRRWMLELPDLIYLKKLEQKELAKQNIDLWEARIQKVMETRGYKKPESAPAAEPAKEEKAKPAAAKPSPPSATDSVKVDTGTPAIKKTDGGFRDILKARLKGQTVS